MKADRTARSTLAVKYVVVAYAALAALIASGVALAMAAWTHRRGRQLSRAAAWALEATLLLAASVPVGTWLAFAIQRSPQTRSAVIVTGLLAAGVVWLAAIVLRATTPPRVALAFVTLGTAVLFAVDQWVGAPLSVTAPLGYSPLEAARFYGLGNEAAALMLSGAVIGLAVGCDQIASKRRRQGMEWLVPVAGFVLVATAVLPRLGANLGVAAWGTFLVVVATRLMSRGRLTWRLVVLGVVIAALATASAVWISSVSSAETHVARTVSSAESSGIGALWTLLVRKAGANLSYLVRFPGIVVFFAIFAGLALGAFRPRGVWGRVADGNPSFNGAMQAILLTCVVAYFSEDSGILMAVTLVDLTLIAFAYLSIAAARAKPLMLPEMSGGEAA